MYARFVSNHAKLSSIVCYTPSDDADDTLEDDFYATSSLWSIQSHSTTSTVSQATEAPKLVITTS